MNKKNYLFTSESVAAGHPDKICDQISDTILDAYLRLDPKAKVACECFATTNKVVVGGEVRTTNGSELKDVDGIVRNLVKEIGYEQDGFHWKKLDIENLLHAQSSDIAIGVDVGKTDEGAGDQGIMFGYAVNETKEYMPSPIYYAHRLLQNIKEANLPDLGPDAKSQITLKYVEGKPVSAEKVLVSIQHREHLTIDDIRKVIIPIIAKTLPDGWLPKDENILINPTGRFVIGGPDSDTGLTGRKIIVDTYGGAAPHGGGAFSGKDATKVDRSAAYATRYLAKNVVANGLAEKCLIQVSYAIGVAKPLSFYINCYDTNKIDEQKISDKLNEVFDLRPAAIREALGLTKPIYKKTATFGHFGRSPEEDGSFSWEKINLKL
jgi:S-adenosylmethionine synthetase